MSKVIFSITQDQVEGMLCLAEGLPVENERIITSLSRKHLVKRNTSGNWEPVITPLGRTLLPLFNSLVDEDAS